MTGNSNATENPTAVRRMPFLGATSFIAGATMPAWVILAAITGGPEAAGWLPVIMLVAMPYNLIALALFVVAVVCGIYALRNAGADRVLGLIGLILAGVQLLVAALLVYYMIGL